MKTAGSYKVKQGDTLYGIAKKYSGVSAENIKTHNNLSSSGLKPGMVLKIPKG
jgi:membrane-bound lytic murein transglycosylase D